MNLKTKQREVANWNTKNFSMSDDYLKKYLQATDPTAKDKQSKKKKSTKKIVSGGVVIVDQTVSVQPKLRAENQDECK